MTGQRLHDLLHELGDTQPAVEVRPDVFRQGRRAHRRIVLLAGASLLAVIAIVGSLATSVLDQRTAPPAGGDLPPAIPTHVYAVPERLVSFTENGYTWGSDLGESDLAVGRASVSLSFPGPVVISAEDGRYHLLDLPGYDWSSPRGTNAPTMALSPDGRRLAYSWYLDDDMMDDNHVPSGVRIVDLETGAVTSIRDDRGYGVVVEGLGWSPNGRYLVYSKAIRTSPNGTSGARSFFVERLDTRTETSARIDGIQFADHGLGVSDAGWVAAGNPATMVGADGVQLDLGLWGTSNASWSTNGERIAFGSVQNGTVSIVGRTGRGSQRTVVGGGTVSVLGWTPDDRVGVLYLEGESAQVELVSRPGVREEVVTMDREVRITTVSVATELLDQPTRDFAEPDWPFDPQSLVVPGLIVGVVVLALGAGYASERQRRRR
ncbi:MAG TPA: hypothetical protein VFK52_04380 [Nocardioidaceae bacterium]|nr:hypothetical protein [Nocardioidaceae bacterium]